MIAVQQIKYRLQKELGAFFSVENHAPSDLIRYINSGVRLLSQKRGWDYTTKVTSIVLANSFDLFAIPETISSHRVKFGNIEDIKIYDKKDFYDQVNRPEIYTGVWDSTFTASQGGTYTLIHSIYPTAIIGDGETIDMPASMEDILFQYSLFFGYLDVIQNERAADAYQTGEILLPSISARSTNTMPNEPIVMQSSYNF